MTIMEKSILKTGSFDGRSRDISGKGDFLYYGLLAYLVLFYSQLAGRYPFLAPFRLEFLLGAILSVLSVVRIARGEVECEENKINGAILLLFAFVVFTIPFAFVKSRALTYFIMVVKYAAVYLMIIVSLDSEKKLKGFIGVYLVMQGLIFVEPFILSLFGRGFIYNNYMMRLSGVTNMFAHPNQLAMVTCTSLPFFFYLGMHFKSKKMKVACFVLMGIALRVIMLTQSRTGFLGVLTFGFLVWFLSKKKTRVLILSAVCLVVIWQVAPQQTKDRFLTFFQTSRVLTQGRSALGSDKEAHALASMVSRWELSKQAVGFFIDNPLIGVGFGCYGSYSGRTTGSWFPPHNTYLQMLAETGIVGTSLFLWIVFQTLKNLLGARKRLIEMKEQDSFLFVVSSAVLTYYVIYLIISIFGIELYSNFWWLTAGLSVALLRIGEKKRSEAESRLVIGFEKPGL